MLVILWIYRRNQTGFIYFDNKTLQRRPNTAGERVFTKQNILIRMTLHMNQFQMNVSFTAGNL